jgi:hypothetical protein
MDTNETHTADSTGWSFDAEDGAVYGPTDEHGLCPCVGHVDQLSPVFYPEWTHHIGHPVSIPASISSTDELLAWVASL